MTAVLEPLIQSPRLPQYVEELKQLLAAENQARRQFRDELLPSDKGEFVNGQVIMHSPARCRHTNVRDLLARLLSAYVDCHQLGWVGGGKVLVTLTCNDFEPDILFYVLEKAARLLPDQMEFPAPDLIVEVLSETTEARDRGVKFEDYAAHGVREYWLVDPAGEFIEQYDLAGGCYSLRLKLADGTLRSVVIAGFAVPVRAVFARQENLEALMQITASSQSN